MTAGPPRDQRSSRSSVLVAALPAVALAILTFVGTRPLGSQVPIDGAAGPSGARAIGIAVGDRAPDFTRPDGSPALFGLDQRPVRLADFAGKPLWIVFWATWCTPCYEEAPEIEAATRAHAASGLQVLAIAVQDPATSVRDFTNRFGLQYAVALDTTAAVRDRYGGWGLPIHFFVDGTGTIRDRYIGQLSAQGMEEHLRSILSTALLPNR
jgi:cytochrome c biogenesis protein CcmG/thiol:disulfide interchange protein DsbE